jgi:hypothetical protein
MTVRPSYREAMCVFDRHVDNVASSRKEFCTSMRRVRRRVGNFILTMRHHCWAALEAEKCCVRTSRPPPISTRRRLFRVGAQLCRSHSLVSFSDLDPRRRLHRCRTIILRSFSFNGNGLADWARTYLACAVRIEEAVRATRVSVAEKPGYSHCKLAETQPS